MRSNEIFERKTSDWNYLLELNKKIRLTNDIGHKEHLIAQRDNFEKQLEEAYEEKQMEKFLKELNGYDEFA